MRIEEQVPALHGEYSGLAGMLPDGTVALDYSMHPPVSLFFKVHQLYFRDHGTPGTPQKINTHQHVENINTRTSVPGAVKKLIFLEEGGSCRVRRGGSEILNIKLLERYKTSGTIL